MNENTFFDSFSFCFDLFVSLFSSSVWTLNSKSFWNNYMHCEIIACQSNVFFVDIFCWNTTEKRKLEKCFMGAIAWSPKLVYLPPKQPRYITTLRLSSTGKHTQISILKYFFIVYFLYLHFFFCSIVITIT